MKAIRMHAPGGANALFYEDVPQPRPGYGEVLVRVHATAITPDELNWQPTWQTATGQPRTLQILSHEFSGTVASLGEGVTDLAEGKTVFGLNDWFQEGAQAEFVVARAINVAPKPLHIDHVQAAVVPISGLTAWQALIERAHVSAGQRVLIHGGAGGVGGFAVQLAHHRGAHVITTVSAHNADVVRALGADEVIDYKTAQFEDLAGEVDVVLDTVGGETLQRSKNVLRPGGTLISVASDATATDYFFYVEPNREQLGKIARLIDEGALRPVVDRVFPLDQTRDAYAHKPVRGKIALRVIG